MGDLSGFYASLQQLDTSRAQFEDLIDDENYKNCLGSNPSNVCTQASSIAETMRLTLLNMDTEVDNRLVYPTDSELQAQYSELSDAAESIQTRTNTNLNSNRSATNAKSALSDISTLEKMHRYRFLGWLLAAILASVVLIKINSRR